MTSNVNNNRIISSFSSISQSKHKEESHHDSSSKAIVTSSSSICSSLLKYAESCNGSVPYKGFDQASEAFLLYNKTLRLFFKEKNSLSEEEVKKIEADISKYNLLFANDENLHELFNRYLFKSKSKINVSSDDIVNLLNKMFETQKEYYKTYSKELNIFYYASSKFHTTTKDPVIHNFKKNIFPSVRESISNLLKKENDSQSKITILLLLIYKYLELAKAFSFVLDNVENHGYFLDFLLKQILEIIKSGKMSIDSINKDFFFSSLNSFKYRITKDYQKRYSKQLYLPLHITHRLFSLTKSIERFFLPIPINVDMKIIPKDVSNQLANLHKKLYKFTLKFDLISGLFSDINKVLSLIHQSYINHASNNKSYLSETNLKLTIETVLYNDEYISNSDIIHFFRLLSNQERSIELNKIQITRKQEFCEINLKNIKIINEELNPVTCLCISFGYLTTCINEFRNDHQLNSVLFNILDNLIPKFKSEVMKESGVLELSMQMIEYILKTLISKNYLQKVFKSESISDDNLIKKLREIINMEIFSPLLNKLKIVLDGQNKLAHHRNRFITSEKISAYEKANKGAPLINKPIIIESFLNGCKIQKNDPLFNSYFNFLMFYRRDFLFSFFNKDLFS